MKNISALLFLIIFASCKEEIVYDITISNARILDVKTGKVEESQLLCIKDGIIKSIVHGAKNMTSQTHIDANGKLITPSFIDAHIHPISEFADGNYDLVPDTIPPDSIAYYRNNLTDGYLPDGTTTVLMMGHPDGWTDEFLNWTKNPRHNEVDVFTCGGALATEDGHTYEGHLRVLNPSVAKEQIIEYHQKGIQHLKLYWRLKEPEFKAIQETADSLGIKMFAHSGGFFDPTQLNIFQAMDMGIRNFEHVAILPCSIFENSDWEAIHAAYQDNFGGIEGDPNQLSLLYILETFKHADENKKDEFINMINEMAKNDCNISTTIGWIYKTYHETFFAPPKINTLSPIQFQRCQENFETMMRYFNQIHNSGIPIRIGTDTNPGGKILLLEMMLMVEYGLDLEEAFKIATINGAEALEIDDEIGSIEIGKRANLIIWDKDPFEDYKNLVLDKTIIKDGVLYTF